MAIAAPGWTALPLRAALGGSGALEAMVVIEALGMAAGLDRSGRGVTQVFCRGRGAGIVDSAVRWEAETVFRCWGSTTGG